METLIQHHEAAAVLIARTLLGLLFFFQGYDAVFRVKIANVITTYEESFENKGIPRFITAAGAWFTSYAELIGGLLLIAGLFQYYALYLLGLNLLIASLAFSMVSPMWDMRFVFPRLALLLFLIAVPASWDLFSLDHLLAVYNR